MTDPEARCLGGGPRDRSECLRAHFSEQLGRTPDRLTEPDVKFRNREQPSISVRMAKDAPSPLDPASELPLDVFHVPEPDSEEAQNVAAGTGSVVTSNAAAMAGANGAAVSSAAAPQEASHPVHAAPLPPVESSIASVVIDAPLLELPSTSDDPAAAPDVPTVRLRPARRSGKRLGREVLLAVFGMGFCLVLYGVGSELLGNRGAPSGAATSIGAARPQGEKTNQLEGTDTANVTSTETVPPLEPAADYPVPEPGAMEPEPPAELAATAENPLQPSATSGAEAAAPIEQRPPPPLRHPPKTKPAGVSPPEPARTASAPKPGNVFDTPLRPPAE
jgi:hypothetical protein